MNPIEETLGEYLKRERELRRVPVEEIILWLDADRRLVDALEENDFELFTQRSEAAQLLRQYATYLNLDQAEVSRRFGMQWKLTGGVKRYPKLTHFAEGGSPVVASGFKRRRRFDWSLPRGKTWLPFAAGVLIVGLVLLMYPIETRNVTPRRIPQSADPEIKAASPAKGGLSPAAATDKRNGVPISGAAPDVTRAQAAPSGGKASPPAKNGRVIGNRDSKRYHLPGMKYYDKVKAYHQVIFQSEREAINAGYVKARE